MLRAGKGEDEMSVDREFSSAVLFDVCGRLASVTGTLAVPVEYPELYTRDSIADVVRRQNAVLHNLRLVLQDLTRNLIMEGD